VGGSCVVVVMVLVMVLVMVGYVGWWELASRSVAGVSVAIAVRSTLVGRIAGVKAAAGASIGRTREDVDTD